MCKGHVKRTSFIKARVDNSVEYQARNLKVLVSSPTVDKNFSFCILTRSWQVDWCRISEIKHAINQR